MSAHLGPDRKATAGKSYRFFFVPTDGYPSAAPQIAVQFAAGTFSAALTPLRAAADKVTAISTDRRQLTIDNEAALTLTTRGLMGDQGGAAWLDNEGVFQGPVKILRVVTPTAGSGVVELAAPMSHAGAASGSNPLLRWNLWHAQVTIADLVERDVRWSVTYTPKAGTDLPSDETVDQGLLHVVRTPFRTGLDDELLYALIPLLRKLPPGAQEGFGPQRWIAGTELVEQLRQLLPTGIYEDNCPGERFRLAHALFTAAVILGGRADGQAEADAFRTRAEAELKRVIANRMWIDLDSDGVVDAGETAVQIAGLGGLFASYHTSTAFDDCTFDRTAVGDDR